MLLIRVTFVSQAFILLFCQSTQVESLTPIDAAVLENDRPIIGILAQEIDYYLHQAYSGFNSYIMASYVKYVESAGARVVPIWIGEPESYYENILEKVNGVLFPGGPACFNETGGYADAGRVIYRIAKGMNDRHDFFPIWGTCLGFELLTFLEANGTEHRSHCDSSNQALPLKFKPEFKRSRMFEDAKGDIIEILENEDVTSNFHNYCVTEEDLAKVHLTEAFRIISTNNDTLGSEFISTLEHINYPFYGVQFHPEKNNFEWNPRLLLPHTANSILISNYFANFFVNEVKELQGAIILLEEAREASRGKRWNASRFLKIQQGNLFKEVNSVLHEALITLADKLMEKNKNTAVKAAVRALECAKDTGNEVFIAKSLFEVGRAEMLSGNIAEAVQSFSRYLAIVKRIPDPNRMCDGHRELAFAYKAIKNIGGVEDHLNMFKELAEKSGLIERLAEANYCLGEFILEQGDPSSATPHLNSAFDLYRSLSMMKEMDKARFLAGISKGKELKIEYLELMRKCEENDPEALRKLLEWKNRRTPFWN